MLLCKKQAALLFAKAGLLSLLCVTPVFFCQAEDAKDEKLPIVDLQKFTKVIDYVKEYYVKPIDDETLFENSIRGMLSGLDPHSMYFNKEEFASLKENTTGKFGGLGIEFLPEDGFLRIISPIDGTPAYRAGIQPGDLIIKINDTLVQGLSTHEVLEALRGEKGTSVALTIVRQGEHKPLKFTLVRDTISAQSVKTKMLEDNFGYVRVSLFQTNSGTDFVQAIQALKKNNAGKLKGIILDLRNNPGGVVDTAVQIADAFLDRDNLKQYDGVIVSAKGQLPSSQIKQKAHPGDLLNGAPIVVLINNGSASASEIVAGALQDYRRAAVVGITSYGKGSMQVVIPLKDDSGLKLTTALYYTPAGRSIQATGIQPDITIPLIKVPAPVDPESPETLMIREQNLQGHLENGNKKPAPDAEKTPATNTKKDDTPKSSLPDVANLMYTDYQLYEALNILKALTLNGSTR